MSTHFVCECTYSTCPNSNGPFLTVASFPVSRSYIPKSFCDPVIVDKREKIISEQRIIRNRDLRRQWGKTSHFLGTVLTRRRT